MRFSATACAVGVLVLTADVSAFVQSMQGAGIGRFQPTLRNWETASSVTRCRTNSRQTLLRMSEERLLTNEECDILNLPRGSKLVGEMSDMMKRQLNTKGKYEDTNNLRYFGNEKIRASNYFGKQKLEANVVRMNKKIRRAEIEELMDQGYSYDAAEKLVDAKMQEQVQNVPVQVSAKPAATSNTSLKTLFASVDRDGSGTISAGEIATAFRRLRSQPSTDAAILKDVQEVLAEMDVDASGEIDFNEFVTAVDLFLNKAQQAPPKSQGGWNPFQGLFGGK